MSDFGIKTNELIFNIQLMYHFCKIINLDLE